jgi:hypothetical protein
MNKLNGWIRICVVLTVLWILGAGAYTNKMVGDQGMNTGSVIYSLCLNENAQTKDFDYKTCSKRADEFYDSAVQHRLQDVLGIALIPVPIFWLIGFIIFSAYRWVKKGFARS